MRKIRLIILLAVMLPAISQAQRYIGIATSNWSGTNGLYLNPANIADSRHKFTIDLFSVNVGINNNLAQLGNGLSGLTNSGTNGTSGFNFQNQQKFSLLAPYAEVRGPGAMVSINSKHSIALTTRVRVMNQLHDFDQTLYRSITDNDFGNSVINGTPIPVQGSGFNFTAHGWTEIGLSYGGVIYDGGQHFVKGGLTLRYLMGAAYVSMTSTGIDAIVYPKDDSLTITNTNIEYGSNVTNNDGFGSNFNDFLGGGGKGFGADLGVVYEWRPDYDTYTYDMDGKTGIRDRGRNKYKLRASVSITDLGSIKYKNDNFITSIKTLSNKTATLSGTELGNKIDNFDSLKAYARSKGLAVDSGTNLATSKLTLPTAMIIGVDYHAIKGLYVNAMFMANVANRTTFGNSYYNQLTVTPRWDTRVFSVGIPLTYDFLTQSIKYGLGARVGGFFLGSDDLSGIMSKKGYGANFYFGASIPINYKKPKDSDGDLVSNKKDKCKNEKGVWEERGCPNPDKDGDGVLDKDDNCPDVPGSKTAKGCPDADLDGVADAEDSCPNESGLPALQGCPDRDGDGVADINDVCPDVAGLPEFKGCPDTDGDGVPDNEDKCPNKPGPVVNEGCPDTDNDGVADNMDKCPEVPGTAENYGCPEVSVEVKKRLAFAATAIQFDLGKASIKKASHKLLDEIVQILNDYPDYNMTIDGYTDNTGRAERNLELSKERANAVKEYFISKGISADRLKSDGHGIENPVASNKTAAGRAKNRRVEMDLKLRD